MSNHRELKLPKWAQIELEKARIAREEAEAIVKVLSQGEVSNIYYFIKDRKLYLPDSASVCFKVGSGYADNFTVRIIGEKKIYLTGGNGISIQPRASNAAVVQISGID